MMLRLNLIVLLVLAASPTFAQSASFDLGGRSVTATGIGLFALLTVLSLAPGLAVTLTCFPLIVTVLSILRQGIGLPQSPPNILIVGLSMFLTWYVMEPVFKQSWTNGLSPAIQGTLPLEAAAEPAIAPFRAFMIGRTDAETYARLAALRQLEPTLEQAELSVLVPSFLLSELKRAFHIGFLVLLPFLIIDIVVSAVLNAMGMMMMPPSVVALPFKLAFFVLVDGWTLISEALVKGYM